MNEKIKILLGSEDIISKNNEDLYININLNRSFNEYKREKYDNDFNLSKQFDKERNACRNFRIYGVVDSNITDCDNYPVLVYSDAGLTQQIYSTTTSLLNFEGNLNIFNKKKGKYYIQLENFSGSSVFVVFPSNQINISEQVYEQKLVFYDFDNDFIPYGTETIEIDNNLNSIEIDNNFPFFYDKHWIKKNINLLETKQAIISFGINTQDILEGGIAQIEISLDKPSPFGNEQVDFVFDQNNSTAELGDFSVYISNPSNPLGITTTLNFNTGEQTKIIYFQSSSDFNVELIENFNFNLENLISVKPGDILTHIVYIEDQTVRQYSNYIVSNLFNNRTPYSSRKAIGFIENNYSTPSVFRNGLYYTASQQEFYPTDNFVLDIKNTGNKTLLPLNSNLGNAQEQVWETNETKTFNINPQYDSSVLNSVELYLPPSLNEIIFGGNTLGLQASINIILESISINGFAMSYDLSVYPVGYAQPNISGCYEAFKNLVGNGSADIYQQNNLDKPFSIVENPTAYTITLVAKSPATRLDVITNLNTNLQQNQIASATTVVEYAYPNQLPLTFTLLGNLNSNNESSYLFSFRKNGCRTLQVNRVALATESGADNYLISSYKNAIHNWDVVNNRPIAYSGDPFRVDFVAKKSLLSKGDIYYQGFALLNLMNTNSTFQNLTTYGPDLTINTPSVYWGIGNTDSGIWSTAELNEIAYTNNELSFQTVKQEGILKISTSDTTEIQHYSFKFKNGGVGEYTTFFWNSLTYNTAALIYNNGFMLEASGSTLPTRVSPGLKYELDLGGSVLNLPIGPIETGNPSFDDYNPYAEPSLTPYQPTTLANNNISFVGGDSTTILLRAKTQGVPFELVNFTSTTYIDKFNYLPIAHNEIQGETSNPYKNHMGGFSLTPP